MPDIVSFDNNSYQVVVADLLRNRVYEGPFPLGWTKVTVPCTSFDSRAVTRWVIENTMGRFGVLFTYPTASFYFEEENSALMFRLKGGDEAF